MGADEVVIDTGEISSPLREIVPIGVDAVLEVVGASTLRDSIKAVRPFGGVSVIGLLGGPPLLERFQLMQDLPGAVRLSFFPSGLLGTSALPLEESPLPWIAGEVAAGRMPSLRCSSFDFDDVRRAHSLIESDRSAYAFEARERGTVIVGARLVYRRAYQTLSSSKGWSDPDILMAEVRTRVEAPTQDTPLLAGR